MPDNTDQFSVAVAKNTVQIPVFANIRDNCNLTLIVAIVGESLNRLAGVMLKE